MIICTDFFARHPYQYLKILLRNGFYNENAMPPPPPPLPCDRRGFTILVIFFWIASLGQNMKILEEFEEKKSENDKFPVETK